MDMYNVVSDSRGQVTSQSTGVQTIIDFMIALASTASHVNILYQRDVKIWYSEDFKVFKLQKTSIRNKVCI